MNPSSEQIERWADHTDNGWVRIPASCWPDLLWCIRRAEQIEAAHFAITNQTVTSVGQPAADVDVRGEQDGE